MYEIVSLQDDPIYRVRKETVTRMINISRVLGKEIFLGILFPVYKKLANDQVWGVRNAAVQVLPQISNLCPPEIKNGILIEMFKKFSQDSSKWVKMATFQFLGPFIASYEGIDPNPLLIDYYITMLEQNKSTAQDNEVPYYCAYNFPAVLMTIGASSWRKLQPVYDQLVKDQRFKVRRTLAFSLHEIAKILGPEIAEKELIPVLHHFLKDTNEVREGVTINLPKFIQVLSPEQRESYVDKLAQTQIDSQDWRKRIMQAKQIRQFCKIFSCETVNKYYVPIFFELCSDQVAEVREEASRCAKNISLSLMENETYLQDFIDKVLGFKESNKFNMRQTFLYISLAIMANTEIFGRYLLQHFCSLKNDRIVNVRIVLAECVFKYYTSSDKSLFKNHSSLRKLVDFLKRDVEYVSQPVWDIETQPVDEENIISESSKIPPEIKESNQEQIIQNDYETNNNIENTTIETLSSQVENVSNVTDHVVTTILEEQVNNEISNENGIANQCSIVQEQNLEDECSQQIQQNIDPLIEQQEQQTNEVDNETNATEQNNILEETHKQIEQQEKEKFKETEEEQVLPVLNAEHHQIIEQIEINEQESITEIPSIDQQDFSNPIQDILEEIINKVVEKEEIEQAEQ